MALPDFAYGNLISGQRGSAAQRNPNWAQTGYQPTSSGDWARLASVTASTNPARQQVALEAARGLYQDALKNMSALGQVSMNAEGSIAGQGITSQFAKEAKTGDQLSNVAATGIRGQYDIALEKERQETAKITAAEARKNSKQASGGILGAVGTIGGGLLTALPGISQANSLEKLAASALKLS